MSEPITYHVISHTHWDREWYLTHEQFRMRLVHLIDNMLELLASDPGFKVFHLDAQTIVLEDYLEIRPSLRHALERYIREGRVLVGPWYQLNDEYLTSGESTIRSLLIGHQIATEFGSVMKVGYLPDQFGNISQMPQIFQGFGTDNCVFGRGLSLAPGRKMEFWWESPDGSRVLASLMALWYNNAQHVPEDPEEAERYLRRLKDAMLPNSATHHLLLMNGVDHLEAQQTLSSALAGAAPRVAPDRLEHSTLPAYIEAIRAESEGLDTLRGELREDRHGSVLAGTLSSRMYLKQANERCQTLLERYAEPFAAWAWAEGADYPYDFLTYAWKLLMQNHPHDSICGCSIDQVHREMVPRFQRVMQVGGELLDRALGHLAGAVGTRALEAVAGEGDRVTNLVVFNPLPWRRSELVEAVVDFPLSEPVRDTPKADLSRDVRSLALYGTGDQSIPTTLLESRVTYQRVLSPVELPLVMAVRRFRVAFRAQDVPALGYATYKAIGSRSAPAVPSHAGLPGHSSLENEFLRLDLQPNGALYLTDKRTGAELGDLNLFESGGDVGDEYRYVRPQRDRVVTSAGSSATVSLEREGPTPVCRVDLVLNVPAGMTEDGQGRREEMVPLRITSRVTLAEASPRVDIETTVENRARDHRLRALFPSGLDVESSVSEGQFDVLGRPVRPPAEWGPEAASSHPQQSWCDVSDGERGLAVMNQGLPEYEVYPAPGSPIALTLLRCVGTLSGGGDAPGAEATPEAQCQGVYTFRYSVMPHAGDWKEAQVWREAHAFVAPLRAVQVEEQDGELPVSASFLRLDPPELVLSALKRAEAGDRLVVRLYNVSTEPVAGTLAVRGISAAWRANLLEEPGESLPVSGGAVAIEARPKQIVTLLVDLEGGG